MAHKILVADDEKLNLVLMARLLEMNGRNYRVFTAKDGFEACSIAENESPDLILMDWEMPVMSGIDAIKKLKSNYQTRDIPIIVQTGLASSQNLQEALQAGAIDYIRKPIDRIELLARVKSALLLHDSFKEIKEQKQRIESHVDELNKLSLIIKQTDNSVVIFNTEGEIEWANQGFQKMYGYSLEEYTELFGDTLFAISVESDIREKYDYMFKTHKSINYTSKCAIKSGGYKWIQTTLTPIFDGNQIEKIIAIESDVTIGKEAELTLIQQNEEMSKLMESLKEANSLLEKQKEEILIQKQTIDEERRKTEALLSNILPHHVAMQLKSIGFAKPRNYKTATVMFTDFKGFTKSCEHLSPDEIVSALHSFFTQFDEIVVRHYIEKIKTIGDAYMCAGGVPLRNRSNPFDVVLAGLEIQDFMMRLDEVDPGHELPRWQLRVGIHTGTLTAGVVGKIKFAYDIWGDTVNIAKRIESACEIGKVNISDTTYADIKDYFDCEYRGKIEIKNHESIEMYFVNGLKPEYSADEKRFSPNQRFLQILNTL